MRPLILIVVLINFTVLIQNVYCAMSDKQIKAAGKLVRNVCQPKSAVTDEQIDDMHAGKWDDVKDIKCYMYCCVNMLRIGKKDGSVDYDAAFKAMQQLPDDKRMANEASLQNCKDETGPDKCTASWNFAKCMYHQDPKNYFFP